MNIVVFGANGPTGRLTTRLALEAGHRVAAVTRHPETFELVHPKLELISADVYDSDAVRRAVAGRDAVISALGVPYGRQEITVYSVGTGNIMSAMRDSGVRRLVCISSSATDPSAGPHGGFLFERILQPFVAGVLGKTMYADMRRMETAVSASGLDWTIMRPSGLFNASAPSEYQIAEAYLDGQFTARIDLASAMLAEVESPRYVSRTAAIVTRENTPTLFQMIRTEAFGK